jgi:hypothetical protein
MGDLSEHFSRHEFADRRTGELRGPDEELVAILERLRRRIGRPLPIVSGYRSAATNRAVGGASRSQHRLGRAADIPSGLVTVDQAIGCGARGIGVRKGWVVHVDSRRTLRPVIFQDP